MNPWTKIIFGVAFIVVLIWNVIGSVNDIKTQRYIRDTVQRDDAQEKCIVDLGVWLQEWLQWRWTENIDATKAQIIEYQRLHPQPACQIRPAQ